MFQGSANLEKLEHFRYVQSSGGVFNGSTHFDYTNYFEVLPSNALERGLFLEADRMRSPRITGENLANQLAVVKEEIRVNVMNRPYGGFPWLELPPVLFDTFANSHNGYGGFSDLESATVADASDFFAKYYAPANAVLAVGGDFVVADAIELIEKHFGGIEARQAPHRPDFGEPPLSAERRAQTTDAHAPLPAVAIGYRVPDPPKELAKHLANVLLVEILSEGDASRLQRALVHRDHLVTDVSAYIGEFGDPFDERDPTALTITAHYPETVTTPASHLSTQEIYTLCGTAVVSERGTRTLTGVEAQGMTACPCAQELVAARARSRLADDGFSEAEIERIVERVPIATHNQRGLATLHIGCIEECVEEIDASTLLKVAEASMSSEIYELMKRSDEVEVVEKAHRRPRFVEDCVREMVAGIVREFPQLDGRSFVSARQENLETIHQHNVVAERHGTLAELRAEIDSGASAAQQTTLEQWLDAGQPGA